ncbi:MAG: phage baseplate assembly protein V [Methanomicrobiales archaeon]|nr:phage baseplate assembly protein V [Methanomicrobiales archaeon]
MNPIEVIKQVAGEEVKKLHLPELGVVTSVFPHSSEGDDENYECSVRLKNRDDFELRHVPVATQQIGFVSIPNVGDLVLLAFINGDINAPVVIGRLYNDQDRPPVSKKDEVVYEPPHAKEEGVRRISMKFPNKFTFTVTDNDITLAAGATTVKIETDGSVTIDSNKDVTITAAKGDLKLSSKNITLEAQQDITLMAHKNATLKADMTARVEGTTTEMKASASGKVEASGTLEVKSSGPLTLQGAIVNIN